MSAQAACVCFVVVKYPNHWLKFKVLCVCVVVARDRTIDNNKKNKSHANLFFSSLKWNNKSATRQRAKLNWLQWQTLRLFSYMCFLFIFCFCVFFLFCCFIVVGLLCSPIVLCGIYIRLYSSRKELVFSCSIFARAIAMS